MPVTMPTCSASAFELAVYLAVRADTFYKKTFFMCQCLATFCVVLLPLFVTNTPSYGAARKVCHGWVFRRENETRSDVGHQNYSSEWDMEDLATWDLLPAHLFNSNLF